MVSHLKEDLEFGAALAKASGLRFLKTHDLNEIRRELAGTRTPIVIWNADHDANYSRAGEVIAKYTLPSKIVALTSKPLEDYPHILSNPIFAHHFIRSYSGAALHLYTGVIAQLMRTDKQNPIAEFFPKDTAIKKLPIADSGHKGPATQAIEKVLKDLGLASRMANTLSLAIDELVINAIFDAPVMPDGSRSRWTSPRHEVFKMGPAEQVDIEFAVSQELIAISVCDRFGSLKKATLVDALGKHYHRASRPGGNTAQDTDPGMGLRGIFESGLSLMAFCNPDKETRMSVFCQRTRSFKEFKQGPRFLSLNFE